MKRDITVIGGGSWGTAMAKVLAESGHNVRLYARRPQIAQEINQYHRNESYLPHIHLPENLLATSDVAEAMHDAQDIYVSVPSRALRVALRQLKPHISPHHNMVSLIKGLEQGTDLRMSQIIAAELGLDMRRVAVASGPNLALEIAHKQPACIAFGSADIDLAKTLADSIAVPYMRTQTCADVVGIELASVLKNITALAIGIADGVGYGNNTKATIIADGLAENIRLVAACGGQSETMLGAAGLGDLIATCSSSLSRNVQAGRALVTEHATEPRHGGSASRTTEGVSSLPAILHLAKSKNIDMPLATRVQAIINHEIHPRDVVSR